jgi:hypothetical protein
MEIRLSKKYIGVGTTWIWLRSPQTYEITEFQPNTNKNPIILKGNFSTVSKQFGHSVQIASEWYHTCVFHKCRNVGCLPSRSSPERCMLDNIRNLQKEAATAELKKNWTGQLQNIWNSKDEVHIRHINDSLPFLRCQCHDRQEGGPTLQLSSHKINSQWHSSIFQAWQAWVLPRSSNP